MSIAYLNGEFLPLTEAKISPLDRGFLFGDGIYEVIPAYQGKMVGFTPHIERMLNGLAALQIEQGWDLSKWRDLCEQLIEKNDGDNLGIYLHVSRGADSSRFHAYPSDVAPTVFAFTFAIPQTTDFDPETTKRCSLSSTQDLRWQRCNIKSTALLGNVMHFQQGYAAGNDETLLFNEQQQLTEASSSNIFVISGDTVATPIADNQILPGITRLILLDVLRKDGKYKVEERAVTMDEVRAADELWVTSSSKEVKPVTELDGNPVGNGKVGAVWQHAAALYEANKYDY